MRILRFAVVIDHLGPEHVVEAVALPQHFHGRADALENAILQHLIRWTARGGEIVHGGFVRQEQVVAIVEDVKLVVVRLGIPDGPNSVDLLEISVEYDLLSPGQTNGRLGERHQSARVFLEVEDASLPSPEEEGYPIVVQLGDEASPCF